MTRKEFEMTFGEDPEDMLGPDWKAMLDDYESEV